MSLAACVARCERVARRTRFPRDEAERLSAANLAAWQAWSQACGTRTAGDVTWRSGTSLIDGNVWSPKDYPAGWE